MARPKSAPPSGDPLALFHPAVARWFARRLGSPTRPQALGWPAVARGEDVLILSPTGSGKTLAAFLVALNDRLVRGPADGVHTLYVSPLKALNADVHANLEAPLAGIREEDPDLPEVTRAVRTGDTPSSARQAIVRRPPDVLITTPESLYLMLTAEKARGILSDIRYVIVDEVHAVLGTKRGAHLALSLERLAALNARPFQRIGLTATVRPPEEAAGFLGGAAGGGPRPVTLVDARERKALDLRVEWPQGAREQDVESNWPAIESRIRELVDDHTSTLVFANNRRLAERLARDLTSLNPQRPLPAHHGSVSKEKRRTLEAALKSGSLAGIVATSSLELGIDVGDVDLAVLVGSPRSVSRGLQRVGRAGHQVGATSRGRILPTHRADLLEAAVLARGMALGDVEATRAVPAPLDVLAQQIVAHVAAADAAVSVDDLLALARGAWPYRQLRRDDLVGVLEMLAGKYPAQAFRELRARLSWDRAADRLRALPGSRLLAIRNGGAIPDRGLYAVTLEDGTRLGELDEEFVFESRVGDVFALGANAWRIVSVEQDRVLVTDAHGELPKAPFWRGDRAPRPYAASLAVGAFLREVEGRLDDPDVTEWLDREYALDPEASAALLSHLRAQREAVGRLPTDRAVVVELFHDDLGDPRLVLHSIFGAGVNGPLALALSRVLGDRLALEIQVHAADDGVLLRFPDSDEPPPTDLLTVATPEAMVEAVLRDVGDTPVFAGLFREAAERALLLPRSVRGERRPFWLQRLRANDLLQVARRFPEFPLLHETYREVLRGHLDVAALREVLEGIHSGTIEVVVRRTDAASPFSGALLFGFLGTYVYEQAPPSADRGRGVLSVPRSAIADLLGRGGLREVLRAEAIAEETERRQGLEHPPRSADELALLLARRGDADEEEVAALDAQAPAWLAELAASGRAVQLHLPGLHRWVLVEEAPLYRAALARPLPPRDAEAHRALAALREGREPPPSTTARLLAAGLAANAGARLVALPAEEGPSHLAAVEALVERFARTRGPFTLSDLLARYPLAREEAHAALLRLEEAGIVAHGGFTPGLSGEEWIARESLEAIHRASLRLARREAEPVEGDAFARFLLAWQGVDRAHRRAGRAGLGAVLDQLAGCALPGEAWERDVLPLRVEGYSPQALAELSTTGRIVWVGAQAGRFRPLRRGAAAPYLGDPAPGDGDLPKTAAAVRAFLRENGASFLHEMTEDDLSSARAAQGLGELARRGEATNDSFEVMRHVLRTSAGLVPRGKVGGRWGLVRTRGILGAPPEPEEAAERLARNLLDRYGVVGREMVAADGIPMAWPRLAAALALMEARGEVRRGYFVRGLSGHQYALPAAVEALREARRKPAQPQALLLSVVDPANPWGSLLPAPAGAPFRRAARNYLLLVDGEPWLYAANHARDLHPLRALGPEDLALAARALHALLAAPPAVRGRRAVTVATWGGRPVLGSDVHKPLEEAGFEAERGKLVLYPSSVRAD